MPTHCFLCAIILEPVLPARHLEAMASAGWDKPAASELERELYERALREQSPQFDNALHITIEGSYGEFYDVLPGETPPRAVLCHACAHGLVEREPWLGKLLRLERSHPHSQGD